jgi:hypothetical protein
VLLSGGAPLAPATHEYLKTVLCIQILQVLQTMLRIRIRSDPKLLAGSGKIIPDPGSPDPEKRNKTSLIKFTTSPPNVQLK